MTGDLPVGLWIAARLRTLSTQGAGVYVVKKGDTDRGVRLIRSLGADGRCRIHTSGLTTEILTQNEGDAYIERALKRDPDLWIIEVEDREYRNIFDNNI